MNEYSIKTIKIGDREEFTVTVGQEMQDEFCRSTGDINPLHIDDAYAKEQGYDNKVVYGMLVASFYSTLVGVYLPGKQCLFHRCDVQWPHPVYIGDTLTVTGIVKEVDERLGRLSIQAQIRNQHGEKVSRAMLIVGMMGAE